MTRKHAMRIAVFAAGLMPFLLFSSVSEAIALSKRDLLSLHIRATTIKSESIDRVLEGLVTEYQVPLGVELADEKLNPPREFNLDLPETTLKEFLDTLVETDARYTWKLEGGVIHVWPLSGRDALVAALLDTKISAFAIRDGSNRYGVYNDVMNLPEIKTKLVVAGVEHLVFRGPGSMGKIEKGAVFDERSLTLRELLDKIVLQTEMDQWVISRWGKNGEYISLKG